MSLSLRELATSTSWPHSSKSRQPRASGFRFLWLCASVARKRSVALEPRGWYAPYLLYNLAAVGVQKTQVAVSVAEIQSGCHLRSVFASIHGGPILLSILGLREP